MANWMRLWDGTYNDDKLAFVAHKAGLPPGNVLAVWIALMDAANKAEDRGSVLAFNTELVAFNLGYPEADITAIVDHMRALGMITAAGRIAAWNKRQPAREDDSAERNRRYRARKKANGHDPDPPQPAPDEAKHSRTDRDASGRSVTQRDASGRAVTQRDAPESESESESEKKNSSPKNSLTLTDAEKVSASGDDSSLGTAEPPPADDWNLAALLLIADRDLAPAHAARLRDQAGKAAHPVPFVLKALHNAGVRPKAAALAADARLAGVAPLAGDGPPALGLVPDPADPDAAEVQRMVAAVLRKDPTLDPIAMAGHARRKIERERREREGSSHGDQAKQG